MPSWTWMSALVDCGRLGWMRSHRSMNFTKENRDFTKEYIGISPPKDRGTTDKRSTCWIKCTPNWIPFLVSFVFFIPYTDDVPKRLPCIEWAAQTVWSCPRLFPDTEVDFFTVHEVLSWLPYHCLNTGHLHKAWSVLKHEPLEKLGLSQLTAWKYL